MPRIYKTIGDLRKTEHMTATFTKSERERVAQAALANNQPTSAFIRHIVLKFLEQAV